MRPLLPACSIVSVRLSPDAVHARREELAKRPDASEELRHPDDPAVADVGVEVDAVEAGRARNRLEPRCGSQSISSRTCGAISRSTATTDDVPRRTASTAVAPRPQPTSSTVFPATSSELPNREESPRGLDVVL